MSDYWRAPFVVALAVAALVLAAPSPRAAQAQASAERAGGDAARAARGLKLAPVPLKLRGLDRRLVGLGSYIVNAQGGCNDCHTNPPHAPGGDPFLGQPERINVVGYLAGGQQFGPTIVSPNLTPDERGLPGGMTYRKFFRSMRFGEDPDNSAAILQVMPWPVYSKMSNNDLRAVFEYLRAIPSRPDGGKTKATS